MFPNHKLYKIEYSEELLRLAQLDLDAALILFHGKANAENTLYHAQQTVEKSLKAILCAKKKPVPLTHDIASILNEMDEKDLPESHVAFIDLTPYATIRRYEEGQAIISREEIKIALDLVEQALKWATSRVNELLS